MQLRDYCSQVCKDRHSSKRTLWNRRLLSRSASSSGNKWKRHFRNKTLMGTTQWTEWKTLFSFNYDSINATLERLINSLLVKHKLVPLFAHLVLQTSSFIKILNYSSCLNFFGRLTDWSRSVLISIEIRFIPSNSQFQGVLTLADGQFWGQDLAWKTVDGESFGSLCVAQSAFKVVETWSELLWGGKFNLGISTQFCSGRFFLCNIRRMANILIQNIFTECGNIPNGWLSQLAYCACVRFIIWWQMLVSIGSRRLRLLRLKSPIFLLGLRSLN